MIARFFPALALIVVLLGGVPNQVRAADAIRVTQASLVPAISEPQWLLSADFYVPVSTRMKEVLDLGIPVYFILEFELTRSRWYWRDKTVARKSRRYRLSWHPITRRYRLTYSGLSREFFSLEQAVASMSSIRGWPVISTTELDSDTEYFCAVRMRLDSRSLPGPLQIDVLNNQDWDLTAPWKRFTLTPAMQQRAKSETSEP